MKCVFLKVVQDGRDQSGPYTDAMTFDRVVGLRLISQDFRKVSKNMTISRNLKRGKWFIRVKLCPGSYIFLAR